MKKLNPLAVVLLVLFLSGAGLLAACAFPFRGAGGYEYRSNGERIYFTARGASGKPIPYSGGIRMMHPMACADCHGPQGRGGRVTMMMTTFDAPDITWDKLSREEHQEEKSGQEEHADHPPYTEETLKRAITSGIDPAGEALDELMPHWRMSEPDLDDLVAFIKSL